MSTLWWIIRQPQKNHKAQPSVRWRRPDRAPTRKIGEQLGLTRERVRQIETEALNKMADSMEDPRKRMEEAL